MRPYATSVCGLESETDGRLRSVSMCPARESERAKERERESARARVSDVYVYMSEIYWRIWGIAGALECECMLQDVR